jgi:DNA-binding IclR family transcriptional regulator
MPGSIQSLERAAAILRLLAGGRRRFGLTEVATSLGLAKATAHGILRTLQREGLVAQDTATGRYQLGAELLRLGTGYLDVSELRARALVWTDDLARASGESVQLGVAHQGGVLIVDHVFRPDERRRPLEVGTMRPLHSSALGKALAAFDPASRAGVLGGERERCTARTITARREVEEVLRIVADRGWACDVEETWDGVASVAAPVHDRHDTVVGAVGITGPVERLCQDGAVRAHLVTAVRDCARAVTHDLGGGRFTMH